MAKKEKEATGGSGLNMDIDLNAIKEKLKSGKGPKMPNKTTMNLAILEKGENGKNADLAIIIVSVIILAIFAKFGVWDVYQKKVAEQTKLDAAQAELDQNKATLNRFTALAEKYSHYFYAFLTDDELAIVNRVELLDMLGTELFSEAAMENISVSGYDSERGNLVTLTFNDVTLDQLGRLSEKLQANDMVENVDINTTSTYEEDATGKINKVINAAVVVSVKNDWLGGSEEAAEENTNEEAAS